MIYLLTWLLLLTSCESAPPAHTRSVTMAGRTSETPLYRGRVPLQWQEISPSGDRTDTTIPLASFQIEGIVLTVHNFPSRQIDDRVPPLAQIERWKKQIAATTTHEELFAQGGFGGYRLEAYGVKEGKPMALLGYSLQLTPLLYRMLEDPDLRADYTIKALGPPDQIEMHRAEIDDFAESFELIEPISIPS